MRDYRVYILGVDGHRFIKAEEFSSDHPDDAAALKAAKQLLDGHEGERWDCGRLVVRLSSAGEIETPELAPFSISVAPADSDVEPKNRCHFAEFRNWPIQLRNAITCCRGWYRLLQV